VFHFNLAKIIQMGSPISVLLEILSHTLREQNVSAIAAIHYSLGHVDPAPATFALSFTSITALTKPV
jgi:hypothetical protein